MILCLLECFGIGYSSKWLFFLWLISGSFFPPSLSKVYLPLSGVKSRQLHPCHCSWALLSSPGVCPHFLSPSTVCVLICKMLALLSLLFGSFCCFSKHPPSYFKALLSNQCNCLIHLLPFFLNFITVLVLISGKCSPGRSPSSPRAKFPFSRAHPCVAHRKEKATVPQEPAATSSRAHYL